MATARQKCRQKPTEALAQRRKAPLAAVATEGIRTPNLLIRSQLWAGKTDGVNAFRQVQHADVDDCGPRRVALSGFSSG